MSVKTSGMSVKTKEMSVKSFHRPFRVLLKTLNAVSAIFHEPFGRRRSPTNAHAVSPLKPFAVNSLRIVNQIRARIHLAASLVKHPSVRTFQSANEHHHIMFRSKCADVRQSVSHLSANGVERAEVGRIHHVFSDVVHHLLKTLKRFRSLRKQRNRF